MKRSIIGQPEFYKSSLKDEPKVASDKRSQRSKVTTNPFREIVTPGTGRPKKLSYNKTVDFTTTNTNMQQDGVQVRKSLTTPNFALDSKQIFNFSKGSLKNRAETSSVHISHQRHQESSLTAFYQSDFFTGRNKSTAKLENCSTRERHLRNIQQHAREWPGTLRGCWWKTDLPLRLSSHSRNPIYATHIVNPEMHI